MAAVDISLYTNEATRTLVVEGRYNRINEFAASLFSVLALGSLIGSPLVARTVTRLFGFSYGWGLAAFLPVFFLGVSILHTNRSPADGTLRYGANDPVFPVGIQNPHGTNLCWINVVLLTFFHDSARVGLIEALPDEDPLKTFYATYQQCRTNGTPVSVEAVTVFATSLGEDFDRNPVTLILNLDHKLHFEERRDVDRDEPISFIVQEQTHFWMVTKDAKGFWWKVDDMKREPLTNAGVQALRDDPQYRIVFRNPPHERDDSSGSG